jgi:hypothetical protein
MTFLISTVLVALTLSFEGCAQRAEPAAAQSGPKAVALSDLVAKPENYRDQQVRVQGRLENAGTNYFKDRRIILRDGSGRSIDVRPWLPLSRPAPSAQTEAGSTLAEFLDRQVELVGKLTMRKEPKRENEYLFEVTSAKVLEAR